MTITARLRYSLGIVPTSLTALARPRRLAPAAPGRALAHGALGLPLGLAAWFVLLLVAVGTARGPFYGFVDPGPWDHSWGGPTLAGAWLAHAGVWLGTLPVAALLLAGLAALHGRLAGVLLGGERRAWVIPVTVVIGLGVVLVVRAWSHQF